MLLIMCTVYDAKARSYIQPFFAPNTAVAERMFHQAVCDEQHDFNRHAEDYTLFHIGSVDQDSGIVKGYNPVPIARAHELKAKGLELTDG